MIPAPNMDKEIKHEADFYRFVGWAHANRKKLSWVGAVILIIAAVIGFLAWHKDYAEQQANAALLAVKLPASPQEAGSSALAEAYSKVAAEHSGTTAAARALLLSGSVYFNGGQYDKARGEFDKYLRDYSDFPLTGQALVGVAASYEAQGDIKHATEKYEELVKRHAAETVLGEAKSALGRLYLAQNKPDLALRYYEELDRDSQTRPDSWTAEAKREIMDVLAKNPSLRKPMAAPTNSMPFAPTLTPTLK